MCSSDLCPGLTGRATSPGANIRATANLVEPVRVETARDQAGHEEACRDKVDHDPAFRTEDVRGKSGRDELVACEAGRDTPVRGAAVHDASARDQVGRQSSSRGEGIGDESGCGEARDGQELAANLWLLAAARRHTSGDTSRMAQRLLDDFRRGLLGPIALELP